MKVLITGSQGFIGSYLCNEFLNNGYEVIGVDNFSKYGLLKRTHDANPNFKFYQANICDNNEFDKICQDEKPDYIIAGAAMIGGIAYFHRYAYDLMAVNERIMATTYDSAIKLHQQGILKRIIVMSSSMVYGNTTTFPTPEDDVKSCSVPESTYGFQKLAAEYFAKGAWIQYKVPYSIVRPFNCVGIGEEKAKDVRDSNDLNDELTLSHVLPDLVVRIMKGQDPLTILGTGQQIRCYTHGKDIARGIRMVLESPNAELEDFNISTSRPTSVLELAQLIWKKLRPDEEFRYVSVPSFDDDVQKRIPDVSKAKELLGFEAEVDLEYSVNEVIEYVRSKNESK